MIKEESGLVEHSHNQIKLTSSLLILNYAGIKVFSYDLLNEWYFRLFFLHTVNVNIHLFIIKAHSSSDGNALGSRVLIPPDVILVFLSIQYDAIIMRFTLIWTRGDRLRRFKEFKVDTCLGEVVADCKTSFIQQQRC